MVDAVVDKDLIQVSATQAHISARRLNINHLVLDGENGHIERATAHIED